MEKKRILTGDRPTGKLDLGHYVACGIDPSKTTIYLQSAIHPVYEINLIFEMLVTVPRLFGIQLAAKGANI